MTALLPWVAVALGASVGVGDTFDEAVGLGAPFVAAGAWLVAALGVRRPPAGVPVAGFGASWVPGRGLETLAG
ncbi:hypothetical protein [Actinacidiphila paucisporea]|uniref:hypothetical protein n=1 Tax=Actinacidiphila paucisporea TaxID=310782 RepID=UPI001160FA28|nr:hypothetical protein [Actinacidiphila paucisporea]